MANSADLDQTAPQGAVWSRSTLIVIPLSTLRNNYIEIKFDKKGMEESVRILGQSLPAEYYCPIWTLQFFLILSLLTKSNYIEIKLDKKGME